MIYGRGFKMPILTEWVSCPVCGETGMRRETCEEGKHLIFCVNHNCASNGGSNTNALRKELVAHYGPSELLMDLVEAIDTSTQTISVMSQNGCAEQLNYVDSVQLKRELTALLSWCRSYEKEEYKDGKG